MPASPELHIRVNGTTWSIQPYTVSLRDKLLREIDGYWPVLTAIGRVVVFVRDGKIDHFIKGQR